MTRYGFEWVLHGFVMVGSVLLFACLISVVLSALGKDDGNRHGDG